MSEFNESIDNKKEKEELVDEFSSLNLGASSEDSEAREQGDAVDSEDLGEPNEDAFVDAPTTEDAASEYVYEKNLSKALEAKEEGNNYFRNKEYDDALEAYSKAITFCPEDEENKENLATFYGNRSAAYFAVEEFELVVEDCTAALALKADYVKVIARRMLANEKLEKYEEALTDAKLVQDNDPNYPKIADKIRRLQIAYDDKMTKMKDEALGKLKELGNSILGNFGMSLDNFKMNQDPATGSWNISMGK